MDFSHTHLWLKFWPPPVWKLIVIHRIAKKARFKFVRSRTSRRIDSCSMKMMNQGREPASKAITYPGWKCKKAQTMIERALMKLAAYP